MLPADQRLTRPLSFRHAFKAGRRSGARTLVTHVALVESSTGPTAGFVVSKAVGNAVVRNRVKRRLRHLCAQRVDRLPAGSVLVVRALPGTATASSATLATQLDRGQERVTR